MNRSAARLSVVLVISAASGLAAAAPGQAAQGVTLRITQLPGEFTAGGTPAPVTVVASRSRSACIKLRWSLQLRLQGARPHDLRADRLEEEGPFPVNRRTTEDNLRLIDRKLDPGTLCGDRTVTARYAIGFAGAADTTAALTVSAEAFSAGGQLLDRTTVTRQVRPAEPSPEPTATGVTTPPQPGSTAAGAGGGLATEPTSGSRATRVGPIGLAVGAVMVMLGLGLLVRVRRRSRSATARRW